MKEVAFSEPIVNFDAEVPWDDLPFNILINTKRLAQLMQYAGMNNEEIGKHRLCLDWLHNRTDIGFYNPGDRKMEINVNGFQNNKRKGHLSELRASETEINKVELLLNHALHHEVGHAVEPEEISRAALRQKIMMTLGSLTLPTAVFLLKESVHVPSFTQASTVAFNTFVLFCLNLFLMRVLPADETFARRFAHRLEEGKQWNNIITLQQKNKITDES